MTFTIPDDLASEFAKAVPPRERSKYLAEALAEKLREREHRFIRACEIANQDPEVLAIERELADLPDDIREPWTDASPR